jgi:hypothetical protein
MSSFTTDTKNAILSFFVLETGDYDASTSTDHMHEKEGNQQNYPSSSPEGNQQNYTSSSPKEENQQNYPSFSPQRFHEAMAGAVVARAALKPYASFIVTLSGNNMSDPNYESWFRDIYSGLLYIPWYSTSISAVDCTAKSYTEKFEIPGEDATSIHLIVVDTSAFTSNSSQSCYDNGELVDPIPRILDQVEEMLITATTASASTGYGRGPSNDWVIIAGYSPIFSPGNSGE